jgi:hypothetical protein
MAITLTPVTFSIIASNMGRFRATVLGGTIGAKGITLVVLFPPWLSVAQLGALQLAPSNHAHNKTQ